MKSRLHTSVALLGLLTACEPAGEVRVQELPPLERSSAETRLGLAELRGPWRFAGWELEPGDTLGLQAELPGLGAFAVETQKRDSLAGFYVAPGGGRAPVEGEIRRDSVVSLVTAPASPEGRYLVGKVEGDTLWVETTTLVASEVWRGEARAAFVRSRDPVTPFRRVRGMVAAAPRADSAALAASADSLPGTPGGPTGEAAAPGPAAVPAPTAGAQPSVPAAAGRAEATTTTSQPSAAAPAREPAEAEAAQQEEIEADAAPEPEPVAPRRQAPRVLGVPVERDADGGDQLP